MVAASVLRGAGDVRFATLAMTVIAWVVTPPLAVLLAIHLHLGAFGGWFALLAEWAIGAMCAFATGLHTTIVDQTRGAGWTDDRHRERLAGQPDLLQPLGQATERHVADPELGQYLRRRVDLRLPAVHHDQLRVRDQRAYWCGRGSPAPGRR